MEFTIDVAAILEAILRYGLPFGLAIWALLSKNMSREFVFVEQ
jgi:hypothetical protein